MSAGAARRIDSFYVENDDREPPPFPPQLKVPTAPNPDRQCSECAGEHKDRAELVHTQAIRLFGSPSLAIETHLPLCDVCAAAARSRGWAALLRTWRKLLAVPGDVFEMLMTAPPGDLH